MTQGKSLVEDMARANVELCDIEQPKRIWLMVYRHAGDICWTADPNPDDADEIETVEYIRADTALSVLKDRLPADDRELVERARNEAMAARVPPQTGNANLIDELADRIIALSASSLA